MEEPKKLEDPNTDNATIEQKELISKVMFKGLLSIIFIVVKSALVLLAANIATFAVGGYYLKDTDPEMMKGFQSVCSLTNGVFCSFYVNGLLKKNHAKTMNGIREVLKDKKEE